MQISVNGDMQELEQGSSVLDLLQKLQLTEGRLAVELNGEIVPRSEFQKQQLGEGDRLEIVRAIGGG